MLNRFKNVLYGTSNATDDSSLDYDNQEAIIGKRLRRALTRSASFREFKDMNSDKVDEANILQDVTGFGSKHMSRYGDAKFPKFRYSRPEFLQLRTDDEILVSADHQIRPIILPRDVTRLPWKSGYAECINAGKSMRNEDQAACHQGVAIRDWSTLLENNLEIEAVPIENKIPWVYFGLFDGHAGAAVAVAAASQLHTIIGEKLNQIAELLIQLEFDLDDGCATDIRRDSANGNDEEIGQVDIENHSIDTKAKEDESKPEANIEANKEPETDTNDNKSAHEKSPSLQQNAKKTSRFQQDSETIPSEPQSRLNMNEMLCKNVTVDTLVIGALESAFWEMDAQIARDKHDYKMAGGCTAIVSLFILGKLYVCNAGDSRAIVYKENKVIPMSFDFTPLSERERILRLGLQRPELMGSDFTHLEFVRKPTRRDLGRLMLYRDAYMDGWSMKVITHEDLKIPLVWGEGKRSRVLATIGVTRGFGDHELRSQYGSVPIKPFLTPEPEVKILPLEYDKSLSSEDVLIMGSDGLWDVTTNEDAGNVVKNSFDLFPDNEESRSKYRYITAAQDLVIHSRGHTTNWNSAWRNNQDRYASLDDIAVFVIPLKQYRDEYVEWKRSRSEARSGRHADKVIPLSKLVKNLKHEAIDGPHRAEVTVDATP